MEARILQAREDGASGCGDDGADGDGDDKDDDGSDDEGDGEDDGDNVCFVDVSETQFQQVIELATKPNL